MKTEKMMRRLGLCIALLCAAVHIYAIDVVVSHSIFYVPDPASRGKYTAQVETYWQVNQRTVHYRTNQEKKIIARIGADIVFLNDSGVIFHDHFAQQTVPRDSVNELAKNRIINLRRYDMPPGMIHMRFMLTDLSDTANKFSYTDSFMVYPHGSGPFFSDIELLDTAFTSQAETPFAKSGRQMIPDCTNFIGEHRKSLFYYAELYDAATVAADEYPLIQKAFIATKETESSYNNVVNKDTITAKDINMAMGSFAIDEQPSGNYYLIVTLENKKHKVLASKSMFFQRLNPHPRLLPDSVRQKRELAMDTGLEHINVLNLSKTFLAKYSFEEVRSILKMLLPFSDADATNTINGFLKKPDDMYMRYYVYNFFAAINKNDPGRAWKEFSEKIVEVNKLFSTHGTRGYNTDRGFMYLRYGEPTEVITVENEQGALPYEIWQYNTLMQTNGRAMANAVFLFYRPNEIDDFKLLHSTVPAEHQNTAWRSYLYVNAGGGNSGNSRAEQYLTK